MNLEKMVNIVAMLLLAALGVAGFMVMDGTAETNKVTADIAKIQSEHKSKVVREVALLTAQVRNLEKDMDTILETLKKMEKKDLLHHQRRNR